MKFKDMPYERPDLEAMKKEMAELTESFVNAADYQEARDIFLK